MKDKGGVVDLFAPGEIDIVINVASSRGGKKTFEFEGNAAQIRAIGEKLLALANNDGGGVLELNVDDKIFSFVTKHVVDE